MDAPEMTEITVKVELFRNNGIATCLLQIETGR